MTSISIDTHDEQIALEATSQSRTTASGAALEAPLVSVVMPAFNEAAIIERSLERVYEYMTRLGTQYLWELIVVNDGSSDATGELAERFAHTRRNVRIYHHFSNFGVGQALRFASRRCRGDYVVVLDMDLSYSPEHIEVLLRRICATRAKIVLTSPYMEGGKVSNVPWLRHTLSSWANRFLAASIQGRISTLTSMVRVYDGPFLRALSLRSMGMEIMPEILYKAKLLGARIEEVPAHLDWGAAQSKHAARRSSMRIARHTAAIILSGFLFRPVIYFIVPGLALLAFAAYVNAWTLIHFGQEYVRLAQYADIFQRSSAAVSAAYAVSPHTFMIGLLALMLAIQLISLGILSLQNKSHFEELFHLGSAIYRAQRGGPEVK